MSFEFFVDNACFLCLDHQLRDHPSKEAGQNTHIEIKCESNSISRVNIEIESKFEKSEEMNVYLCSPFGIIVRLKLVDLQTSSRKKKNNQRIR